MGILLNTFQHLLKDLTEGEKATLIALDNRPELLSSYNLTQLSEQLSSSNSTIIRLAQKLGFEGFSEFKLETKKLIKEQDVPLQTGLLMRYQYFFNEILPSINPSKLNYFAEKLYQSHNIFIVGLGLTKPIAEYMSKHLYQLDRASAYVYENHMLDLLPNLLRRGDLVIFISESGETKSLLNCATKVAQTGACLLSITNSIHNSLNYTTHMSLTSQMPESYYHNYDITSRVFQTAIIDLVLDIYAEKYLKK